MTAAATMPNEIAARLARVRQMNPARADRMERQYRERVALTAHRAAAPCAIEWSKGQTVRQFTDEWANFVVIEAPFRGEADAGRMEAAVRDRVNCARTGASLSRFHVDADRGVVVATVRYWIGD